MSEAQDLTDLAHVTLAKPKAPLLPPAWRAEELAAEGAACGWRVGLATVRAATVKGVSE